MEKEVEKQYENTPSDLKGLWSVQLDLLSKFADICKKHNLRWFVEGGTLLGAVRHHGFIPWDDDIDISMPYEDYCSLINLSDEFEEPYFLQTWKTNEGTPPFLCRLRRSDTTGYTHREKYYPADWNKGVFIDIFAICSIPDNRLIAQLQKVSLKFIRGLYFGYQGKRDGIMAADSRKASILLKSLYSLFSVIGGDKPYMKLSDLYVKIGGWQKKPGKYCGIILFRPYYHGLIWKSEWYKNTLMLDFMDMSVPCPADFNSRLTAQYGDYMTPVKQPSYHGSITFDINNSYKTTN